MQTPRCNRAISIALIILAAILGLGSRRFAPYLPDMVVAYTGDTTWALAVFLGLRLLFPTLSPWSVAWLALLISTLVEFSQLYHAPWIDSIRATRIGHLALGSGFDPDDLACYAAGIGIGVLIETVRMRHN
jgi:hypothetical protein